VNNTTAQRGPSSAICHDAGVSATPSPNVSDRRQRTPRQSEDARATTVTVLTIVPTALVGLAILFPIFVALKSLPIVALAIAIVGVVIFFVGGGRLLGVTTKRIAPAYRRIRESAQQPAERSGWTWAAVGPAPTPEVVEAVFRMGQMPHVADRTTEVITGTSAGYAFRASHIEGHEEGYGSKTSGGPTRTENIVQLTLSGLLPELRLRDRLASNVGDYGMSMPSVSSGDARVDARWDIQTTHPDFARDFLDPAMLSFLASVPAVPCTIVCRMGELISCRDIVADFASISARLEILVGIASRIPAACWNRSTPEMAGRGHYPIKIARPNIVIWESARVTD
jgi:hypothetical protein